MTKITRPDVADMAVGRALASVRTALSNRLKQHGSGAFAGPHEIDGLLDEEVREWKDAVRDNEPEGRRRELVDIAVVCLFGLASLEELDR